MEKKTEPLISFDTEYYKYPNSVSRGYWARYPVETNLNPEDKEDRAKWIEEVERISRTKFHKLIFNCFFSSPSLELYRYR